MGFKISLLLSWWIQERTRVHEYFLSATFNQVFLFIFLFKKIILFIFYLSEPHGMRDRNSLTRGQNPCPLQWKHRVLTTGQPGKSPIHLSNNFSNHTFHFQNLPGKETDDSDLHRICLTSGIWNEPFYHPWRASQVVLVVKNPLANVGELRDMGSIPGSRRSPGGGHGNLLQYSCLENPWTEEPGGL